MLYTNRKINVATALQLASSGEFYQSSVSPDVYKSHRDDTVVFYYDYALYLQDEVRYFWNLKETKFSAVATIFYLLNRYLQLCGITVNVAFMARKDTEVSVKPDAIYLPAHWPP